MSGVYRGIETGMLLRMYTVDETMMSRDGQFHIGRDWDVVDDCFFVLFFETCK